MKKFALLSLFAMLFALTATFAYAAAPLKPATTACSTAATSI